MVEFVSRLSEDDSGTSPPPLDIEDPRTVKLLTVHAAKGLEFDAVILADTLGASGPLSEPQYDAHSRVLLLAKPDERADALFREASANIANAELQENLRLLYVAMTRAKNVLAVNWYLRHNKKSLNPDQPEDFSRLLSLLHGEPVPSDEEGGNEVSFRLRQESEALVRIVTDVPEGRAEIAAEPASWEGVDLEQRTRAGANVEGSALVAATGAAGSLDTSGVTDADRLLGEALHSALELWDLQTDPAAMWGSIAEEYGLTESDAERGLKFLELFSKQELADWLRKFSYDKELDLFAKLEGRWVSGRADLVVYAPNEIRVVDYKLSVSSDNEAAYSEQVRVYEGLLRRRFPTVPVRGYLYDLSRGILIPLSGNGSAREEPRA